MSVEFEGENRTSVLYEQSKSDDVKSAFVRWLISTGVVKTSEQANVVLIVVMIVIFISAVVIFYRSNRGTVGFNLTSAQLEVMQQSANHASMPMQ